MLRKRYTILDEVDTSKTVRDMIRWQKERNEIRKINGS